MILFMELYFNDRYPSQPSIGLNILFKDGCPVVVMTHLSENFISPLQNLVEVFATDIYSERLSFVHPLSVIWIEHKPYYMSSTDDDEFEIISMQWLGKRRVFSRRWRGEYECPSWSSADSDLVSFVKGKIEMRSSRCSWGIGSSLRAGGMELAVRDIAFPGIVISFTDEDVNIFKRCVVDVFERIARGEPHAVSASYASMSSSGSRWKSIVWLESANAFALRHGDVCWEVSFEDMRQILQGL